MPISDYLLGSDIAAAAGSGNVTLDLTSATLEAGDYVVLFGLIDGAAHPTNSPGPVTAGYSELVTPHIDTTNGRPCGGAWYKKVGVSPDSSVEGQGSGSAITRSVYGFFALRGMDPGTLLDATYAEISGTGGPQDPAGVTTATNGALVMVVALQALFQTLPSAAPTDYSEMLGASSGGTWDLALVACLKEVVAAGAENPGTFTWTDVNQAQHIFTIPLRVDFGIGSSDDPLAPELSVTYTDVDAFMTIDGFTGVDPDDVHADTTWQITTAADTQFSAPVVNVVSDTYLLSYNALAVLTASTAYLARARTEGLYGPSDWSDIVSFTTESALPAPDTPTLSIADATNDVLEDSVTLTLSDFDSSEGVTTAEDFDPDNPLPYLIAIQWQITTNADASFATPVVDTELAANIDLVRMFTGLTQNTAYRARARQQDGYYGTTSGWSNVVTFTTDATPVDQPGTPIIYIDLCTIDGISLSSTVFDPFGAETHTATQWRARPHSTDEEAQDAPVTTTDLTSFEWGVLPAGRWWFDVRHRGSNNKWSLYSDTEYCDIYDRPPIPEITDPVSGVVVEANETITWTVPSSSEEWNYTGQISDDEGVTWTAVHDAATTSYTFTVAGRANGFYWFRVKACYPESHPAEGQCSDWSSVQIHLDTTEALAMHYDFRGLTSVNDIPGNPLQLWDQTSNSATWTLVDRYLGGGHASIGIMAKNSRQLATRQSNLIFQDLGKPVAGRFTASFAIVPTSGGWFPYRFAHAYLMRGGIGYRVLGTGATDRSGLQFVANNGINPWGFYGQACACSCAPAPGGTTCDCCANNFCVPCETCHGIPTACDCSRHLTDLAQRGRTQPGSVWRYGVSYRRGTLERWGRRQGSATQQFYRSATVTEDGDQIRGMGVAIRPEAPDDEDVTCMYSLTWYDMVVDVRREGSQWRVKARVVGPGLSPSGWTQNELVSLGEPDGSSVPCGYCGLALWHLASNIVNDHGVLFRSFSASGLEYEVCAPAEVPCVRGHAVIRILSKDTHPAHGMIDAMVVGAVPCPPEE